MARGGRHLLSQGGSGFRPAEPQVTSNKGPLPTQRPSLGSRGPRGDQAVGRKGLLQQGGQGLPGRRGQRTEWKRNDVLLVIKYIKLIMMPLRKDQAPSRTRSHSAVELGD